MTLGGILAEEIHKTAGKILAGDDHDATARPLPRTPVGPQPGSRLPRCHRRPHASASSTSWAGTCVETGGLYTNSASTRVVACDPS